MSTGYAAKRGSTNRNAWGQQYGSHGQQNAGPAQMRLGVDFPYVCERCLGPNPYVQMIKQNFGAACKISQRPFHVFKWTNPQTSRRMKTIISYEAASVRNCCQACMSDMTYGVPLVVRDALLKAAGQTRADLPESEVGQSFFFSQREQEHQLVASGAVGVAAEADPRLQLENAAAQVFGGQAAGTPSVSTTIASRSGDTLWIAVKQGETLPSEGTIRGAFASFGEIRSVRCLAAKGFAFVEFVSPAAAAAAIGAGVGDVGGVNVLVRWAKQQRRGGGGGTVSGAGRQQQQQHQRARESQQQRHPVQHDPANRPLAAAHDPALWAAVPAATHGSRVPPPPVGLRAFLSPDAARTPRPPVFPLPTLAQAKQLYPSLAHSQPHL